MNKVKLVLVTILVIALAGVTTYHNQTKKRILVIHSYNTDFPWVLQINGGIEQYLEENPAEVVVRYHYMDLRNHPTCEFYRSAANDARLVIQNWQPEVIIVVDDIGQSLVSVNYLQFNEEKLADANITTSKLYERFAKQAAEGGKCKDDDAKNNPTYFGIGHIALANQPVVIFAGVNGKDEEKYGYVYATNVTGIFENKNANAIIQTIEDIYRVASNKPTSIQVLSENSNAATSEEDFFKIDLPSKELSVPLEWKPVIYAETLDEWKQAIAEANNNGSMLLIANYSQIKESLSADAALVETKELISMTEERAEYPVLGASTNFINDGGLLTLAIPGYEQGEVSIIKALEVIRGEPLSEFKNPEQFIVGMKQGDLEKSGLDLPLIYESLSRQSGSGMFQP